VTIRWGQLRRRTVEAGPGVLFLGVWAVGLWVPLRLMGDPRSGLIVGSLLLQTCGLLAAVYGLRQKGILFDRDSPWIAAVKWFKSLRLIFVRPTPVHATLNAGFGRISGKGLGAAVAAGPLPLEERVQELEKAVEELKKADRKLRSEVMGRISEVVEQFGKETAEVRSELLAVRDQLDRSAVGNFPWEWVGVGWLLIGVISRLGVEIWFPLAAGFTL